MNPTIALTSTLVLALLTMGLIFAAIRRRQTEHEYLLFWRLSPRMQAATRHMFFNGPAADLSRILLFSTVTLLFASHFLGLL